MFKPVTFHVPILGNFFPTHVTWEWFASEWTSIWMDRWEITILAFSLIQLNNMLITDHEL